MRLQNKTAIITGAAHGIGEATAHRFADEGATVALMDIDSHGESVAAAITDKGGQASYHSVNLSSEDDIQRGVAEVIAQRGCIDVLVNNAGATLPKGFETTTQDEWDRLHAVNLRALFLTMRECSAHLRSRPGSSIINVASFHARSTISNFGAYAASKAGVVGLTRSAAFDLGSDGVRVNAVCPGIIQTQMWDAWLREVEDVEATVKEVLALQPLGRVGLPIDVANAIVFLASDEAAYITATELYVDGGVSTRLHHA